MQGLPMSPVTGPQFYSQLTMMNAAKQGATLYEDGDDRALKTPKRVKLITLTLIWDCNAYQKGKRNPQASRRLKAL